MDVVTLLIPMANKTIKTTRFSWKSGLKQNELQKCESAKDIMKPNAGVHQL